MDPRLPSPARTPPKLTTSCPCSKLCNESCPPSDDLLKSLTWCPWRGLALRPPLPAPSRPFQPRGAGPPQSPHPRSGLAETHVGGWAAAWASRAAGNLARLQTGLAVFAQHLLPGRGRRGAGRAAWSSSLGPAPLWPDVLLGSGVTSSKELPLTSPRAGLGFLQVPYFYLSLTCNLL